MEKYNFQIGDTFKNHYDNLTQIIDKKKASLGTETIYTLKTSLNTVYPVNHALLKERLTAKIYTCYKPAYDSNHQVLLDDYCVSTYYSVENFNRYIELCKKYNLAYSLSWNGTGGYYGSKNNKVECSNYRFGKLYTL